MKKITLYRASASNAGLFIDAGNTIEIGDGDDQISADRAKDLLDTGGADSATAAAKAETANAAELGSQASAAAVAPVDNAAGSTKK